MKLLSIMLMLALAVPAAQAKKTKDFKNEQVTTFLENYSNLVLKNYDLTLTSARDMQSAVNTFLNEPTEATLEAAKKAWIAARQQYSKTEAYRFYGGPIDAAETGPEGLINAWPLDEAYIDYVKGNPKTGIINMKDKYPTITKELLISLNEKDGEVNIATGYHAIEFLLWGQDLSKDSAGKRGVEDYLAAKNENAERRKTYLKLTVELLIDHLSTVKSEWENGKYLAVLKKEDPKTVVQKIMMGLTTLSFDEMSGERMTVAFEKNDQENEQDCFSDNSLNDLAANQEGIIEVFETTNLKSLFDNKAAVDSISKTMKENLEALKAIKGPFDRIVSEKTNAERPKVKKLIGKLQTQARLMNKLGKEYGLELNVQ